jgi:glycosyltransferase involved in cell wall biosynthesis
MPGCIDIVRDGWSGLLVPPHSPRLLASGIIELLDGRDAAAAMGARASNTVRQEFGLDLTTARYVAAYNELLDDPIRRTTQAANSNLASPLRKRIS